VGTVIGATCPDCKLGERLALGGGFLDFTESARVPADCIACHRLVLVNAMRQPPWPCPTDGCQGAPALIGELSDAPITRDERVVFDWLLDDTEGIRYLLRAAPHRCPACGGGRLSFEMMGSWD
jgi:hypothetical protein